MLFAKGPCLGFCHFLEELGCSWRSMCWDALRQRSLLGLLPLPRGAWLLLEVNVLGCSSPKVLAWASATSSRSLVALGGQCAGMLFAKGPCLGFCHFLEELGCSWRSMCWDALRQRSLLGLLPLPRGAWL